jgi:hypothetical protein
MKFREQGMIDLIGIGGQGMFCRIANSLPQLIS